VVSQCSQVALACKRRPKAFITFITFITFMIVANIGGVAYWIGETGI
jgi:hypothetical protein